MRVREFRIVMYLSAWMVAASISPSSLAAHQARDLYIALAASATSQCSPDIPTCTYPQVSCLSSENLPLNPFDDGIADDFCPPVEPASPGTLLIQSGLCANSVPFDTVPAVGSFCHTITGIPVDVTHAILEIRLRAHANSADACNDSISLQNVGGTNFIWSYFIGTGPQVMPCNGFGILPNPWQNNRVETLCLDLANLPGGGNVLTQMTIDGRLDVYVENNTGVDYVRLWMTRCSCEPAPTDLVAWWPLDEEEPLGVGNGLSNVRDLSPNKLHGDVVDGPAVYPNLGMVDGAYTQGGLLSDPSLVVVPHDAAIGFDTGNFTIDAWVILFGQADASIYRYVVSKMTDAPTFVGYRFWFTNDTLVLTLGNGFPVSFNSNHTITDDEWHFVAVTVNRANNDMYFYVDGEQVAAGDLSVFSGAIGNGVPLQIGGGNAVFVGAPGFFGRIDEVELFDRALEPEEISAIYLVGTAGKCKCICPADVNQDNVINGLDLGAFNRCLLEQPIDGDYCRCADMNNDGFENTGDVDLFVSALLNLSGPCPPY